MITVKKSALDILMRNLLSKAIKFPKDSVKSRRGTCNEEGSGLGLILCSCLLERHNWHMHLESTAGKGSKVTFTLPCSKLNFAEV